MSLIDYAYMLSRLCLLNRFQAKKITNYSTLEQPKKHACCRSEFKLYTKQKKVAIISSKTTELSSTLDIRTEQGKGKKIKSKHAWTKRDRRRRVAHTSCVQKKSNMLSVNFFALPLSWERKYWIRILSRVFSIALSSTSISH